MFRTMCCPLPLVAVIILTAAGVGSSPPMDRPQSENAQTKNIVQNVGVNMDDNHNSDENNKTINDVQIMELAIMNRPVAINNVALTLHGGQAVIACVQSCYTQFVSVSDIHSCHRECLNDPYWTQSTTKSTDQLAEVQHIDQ